MVSVATASAQGVSTSAAVTMPSGILVGNLMMAVVTIKTSSTVTVTPPDSGWVAISTPMKQSAGNVQTGVYVKTATSADQGNPVETWGLPSSTNWAVCVAVVTSGESADVENYADDGAAAANVPVQSVTASAAGTVFALGGIRCAANGAVTFTAASGWTLDVQNATTSAAAQNPGCFIAHIAQGAAGATPTASFPILVAGAASTGWAQTAVITVTTGTTSPWKSATVKYWNGSAWVTAVAVKVWNGSAWVAGTVTAHS